MAAVVEKFLFDWIWNVNVIVMNWVALHALQQFHISPLINSQLLQRITKWTRTGLWPVTFESDFMNNSLLFSCSHFSAHSAYHKLRNYYDYGNIFQSPAIANLSTRPSVDPQSVLNSSSLTMKSSSPLKHSVTRSIWCATHRHVKEESSKWQYINDKQRTGPPLSYQLIILSFGRNSSSIQLLFS